METDKTSSLPYMNTIKSWGNLKDPHGGSTAEWLKPAFRLQKALNSTTLVPLKGQIVLYWIQLCAPKVSTRLGNAINKANSRSRTLSCNAINHHTVQWAISTFSSYKSPGPDNIHPCLLQQGSGLILNTQVVQNQIPSNWREVNVVFITNEQLPEAYRPITLSFFIIKTMEKVLNSSKRNTIYILKWQVHYSNHS